MKPKDSFHIFVIAMVTSLWNPVISVGFNFLIFFFISLTSTRNIHTIVFSAGAPPTPGGSAYNIASLSLPILVIMDIDQANLDIMDSGGGMRESFPMIPSVEAPIILGKSILLI